MSGWVLLGLLLALPLVSWALLARTTIIGASVAAALLGGTAAEFALAAGDASRFLVAVIVPAALAAVPLAGFLVEGSRLSPRGTAGALVWFCYCAGCLASYGVYATGTGWRPDFHNGTGVPAASDVLPLGPGLAVTRRDLGCGTGEWTTCAIEFGVRGTAGQSPGALLAQVSGDLRRAHGWPLGSAGSDPWKACRRLGSEQVCVQVNPTSDQVTVYLLGYPGARA